MIGLVAVLGGVGAALAAARRTLRQPVTALLRQVPVRRSRWGASAAEAMMVALAGAALFQLLTTRGGDDEPAPLALATPALLAIVLGTAAAKLLPVLARWSTERARRRGNIARMLASAQIARRPVATRVVAIGGVAVALLVFGAHAWDTADHNRKLAAGWQIGADRILAVEGTSASELVEIVRRADPSGRHAMAGLRSQPSNGTGRSIVAVDATRLAAVATWDRAVTTASATTVASALRPATRPAVMLSGDTVTVDVTVKEDTATKPLVLTMFLDDGRDQLPVKLGALTVGRHTYTADLPQCADGCRFVGIKAARPVGPEVFGGVAFVVTGVRDEDGRPVSLDLGSLDAWRNADGRGYNSVSTVGVENGGLSVAFQTRSYDESLVRRTDTPWPLPALVTRAVGDEKRADAAILDGGAFEDAGAFTPREIYQLGGEVPIIPRGGDNAILVDISYADIIGRSSFTGRYADAQLEVWLAAGAPAEIPQRLREAGVVIVQDETYAERLSAYEREGPSLALILYLGTAGAAALLAVGAVGVSAYIGARRRRQELASLRLAGVSSRALRRSIALEYAAVIGTLLVAGAGAGALSVWLALPEVPIFTDPPTDGLSRFGTEPVWAATLLAVTVAGLAAVVVLIVRGLTRGGDEEGMA